MPLRLRSTLPVRTLLALASLALGLAACQSDDGANCPGGKCDGLGNCSPDKQGLALKQVFPGLTFQRPTFMVQRPGDASRWYLGEQRGIVSSFANVASGSPDPEVFLDIRSRTNSQSNEAGLFSIAFHPHFKDNGQVFVSYTGSSSQAPSGLESRISRFVSNDGGKTLDPASETKLITMLQPFTNHNGGQLAFGPDGFLYIGFGDGGSAGDPQANGQNKDVLFGKILRIDVDHGTPFAIPSDNPFAQGGGRGEIFAYGIRNPWRFSFDRATGDLWLGDVGQDKFEEIDIVQKGKNYGWRLREAAHCFNPSVNCPTADLVEPVAEYSHDLGVSVTGGFVYHGSLIPSLAGQYVFADFSSGRLFASLKDGAKFTTRVAGESGRNIASFAEGADGELYALDFASGGIFQVVPGECLGGSQPTEVLPDHIFLSRDGVGTDKEASAYYLSNDAATSLTLTKWIDDHVSGDTVSAFYHNTADLGFWREMTCSKTITRGAGGCWVRNWKNPEDKDNGGKDLGTVAMDVSEDGFTRFYAFAPGGKLSPKASLDSEGAKFVPRLCTPCHGGQYLGVAANGNLGSIFREFEVSLLAPPPGVTRAELEPKLFALNQAAKSANAALTAEADGGPPGIDHAKDAIKRYIDEMYGSGQTARDVDDDAHLPPTWKAGANATVRTAQAALWKQVVNPVCMGCHRTNTVDFSKLADFMQLGPNPNSPALMRTYLAQDPKNGKGPLSFMPQAELMFNNLHANSAAVSAIEQWLIVVGDDPSFASGNFNSLAIPDGNQTGVTSTLSTGALTELQVQKVNLAVDIQHTHRGDIALFLTPPGGSEISVISLNPTDANDDVIGNIDVPVAVGSSGIGTWTLRVVDRQTGGKGTLRSWSLGVNVPAP